jgi:hypothetical protein
VIEATVTSWLQNGGKNTRHVPKVEAEDKFISPSEHARSVRHNDERSKTMFRMVKTFQPGYIRRNILIHHHPL